MDATVASRVLITGVSSWLGGRLAQALEPDRRIDAIVGVDTEDPTHEFARVEFVRVPMAAVQLRRIIEAVGIDTVIDTRLLTDPLLASSRQAREVNLHGTAALLEACRADPVRRLVFKSSAHYYGSAAGDPSFFSEEMSGAGPGRTAIEHEVASAEQAVGEFAATRPGVTVTVMRVTDVVVGESGGSLLTLLGLPAVTSVLGFDPRMQFVHGDDVVGALRHALERTLPGPYNVAADGVLPLSEVAALMGKPLLPVLPPWGLGFAATQLRRLGLRVPVEMVHQLRYGRGLDNRRLKVSGYEYRYTSREAVIKLRAHQRLRPLLGRGEGTYRYEPAVEEFLRWSPSVQAERATRRGAEGPGNDRRDGGGYDDLAEGELVDIIPSLDLEALERLYAYEAAHQARGAVVLALEQNLARLKQGSATGQEPGG
jgi:UDP-glucose 4-epimerase